MRALALLLSLAACGAVQEEAPRLAFERVEIQVGEAPHVLAAELTGDRRPDLAVAAGGRILILAGDGSGGFRRTAELEAGENPTGLVAHDVDGDGDPDLAAANHETDYLTVLLNDGRGGFRPAPWSPVRIEVDPHPHVVAASDLDADGSVDLLVDHRNAGGLLPLYGTDGGGYAAGDVVEMGGDPYRDAVVEDLNGDGIPDLATPNEATVGIRFGESGGRFGELGEVDVSRVAPYGLAAGDLDGDGRLDLVASSGEGGDGMAVLLGDGAGGFRPAAGSPFPAVRGFSAVEVGDLDGDGRDDAAVTGWESGEVVLLFGWNGAEGGAPAPDLQRVAAGEDPWSVSAADFDGDGRDDLAVALQGPGAVLVLLGRSP